jgi:outer membrane protein OmpA-like peptidoglycan-associated protein
MKKSLMLTGASLCVLAGCASMPQPDAQYTSAQQTVGMTANNPNVVKYAEPQVQGAKNELSQAGDALQKGDTTDEDYHSFMASRYAETAHQIAQEKRDEQTVANAPLERDQALLQKEKSEAERARAEAAAARNGPGMVITPRDIMFAEGSAQLNEYAQASITHVAAYLKQNPGRKVMIRGFTDSTGSAALNEQLSQERADAVRLALANDGVDQSRIQIMGMGPSEPIASNSSAAGRLMNRRVQIMVSNEDGNFPRLSMAGTGSTVAPPAPVR